MPLSLFNHSRFVHYRTKTRGKVEYDHSFGGSAREYGLRFVNARHSCHVIFHLDLRDPAVPVTLPGLKYLPLVYGFHYNGGGTLIYRLKSAKQIEILEPAELEYDPSFPYPGHPRSFPRWPVAFKKVAYDRTRAEDALALQGIFGLDGLSRAQLKRAIRIAAANNFFEGHSRKTRKEATEEEILRVFGRAPFCQGPPRKSCDNPACTAEIAYHEEALEIKLSSGMIWRTEAHDVRVDTMRVIALHEPEKGEKMIWGETDVQLIFEFCDCCHCFRVSNQCT